MRVEGRDLIDLGLRQPHFGRERRKMRRGDMAVLVLDQMQVLDQQIAPARTIGQQRLHFGERLRIDLPALGSAARLAAWLCAVAADARRILDIHCWLRGPRIERSKASEQHGGFDDMIEKLYQYAYVHAV